VISRDDYPDVRAEHKKLDKIFPFDAHWATAIILDDNAETWNQVQIMPPSMVTGAKNASTLDGPCKRRFTPLASVTTALFLTGSCYLYVAQVIEKPGERKRNSIENLIHVVKYKFWSNDLGETHNPVVAGGAQDDEAGAGGDGAGGDKGGDKDASSHDSYIEAMFAGTPAHAQHAHAEF